ncbi:TPA: autotransporter domain-containing protein [Salmonella enterica subsp. enterica serovar Muenchen]|nr:autotransporter domain-containing protein [Salmonella enterica subsp. enterica serovar Muenchen]HEC8861218.1 autotransporter domain-containing protein [Salmonella enterica subsp. enterica serovar Muenchen]
MQKVAFAVAISLALGLSSLSAGALDRQIVYNARGVPVFETRFFDTADGPFMGDNDDFLVSTWRMNSQQMSKIVNALNYWAQVLTPPAEPLPSIINVGTYDEKNAAGYSAMVSETAPFSLTKLQAAFAGQNPGTLDLGSHAQFTMGLLDFDTIAYQPSQLPPPTDTDLASVALHELAHGLGVTNQVEERGTGDVDDDSIPVYQPHYAQTFGTWTEHLHDDNGNPARRGQVILCTGCNNAYDPSGFDVRLDQGYFAGDNVNEVLAGAMRGVPVKILGIDGSVDADYMSHSELKNSLMSHQNYRNYTTFMEAELAILQDMGYKIDRRNFFGYSVYGNGQMLVNQYGYSQRNADGTAYIPGAYNTALTGLGLHIYGSNNQLFQAADLLTAGAGGVGVRVDGEGNTLTVLPGTRIYADGLNGQGVIFAYGKDHNFVQRGDVQAQAENGVAARFDFGNNLLGNSTEYRGSYIRKLEINNDDGTSEIIDAPLTELEGAMVNNVDITGRLAGNLAAIYISPNALVNNINVMSAAKLQGDIISEYNQQDDNGNLRLTQLTFGMLANELGRATDQPDSNFLMRYDHNISGINNLALNAAGGATSLNGDYSVYRVNVNPNTILGGNGQYILNTAGLFTNNGTVSPGNSLGQIVINGDYQQGPTGQLLMEVDAAGNHDTLIVNGNAGLDGQLTMVPLPDWYGAGWQLSSAQLLQSVSYSGDFSDVNSLLFSPTLAFEALPEGGSVYQLALHRSPDAYSQYGQDENARRVGTALGRIVANAAPDVQPMLRALDFSAVDGSDIARALSQLSPAGYSAILASSLTREQQISNMISARQFATAPGQLMEDEWRSFAVTFGGGAWQNSQDNHVGYDATSYGILFGVEKQSPDVPDWVTGFHGTVSGQTVKVKSPGNGTGKTTAFSVGMQAHYAIDPRAGIWLFGNSRVGVEHGQMDRSVNFLDYSSRHHADWKGYNGSLAVGGGYNWALSELLSVDPLAALNYTVLYRHGFTESGEAASRMHLNSKTFRSMQSQIGVAANWDMPLSARSAVKANLQLTWKHELLDTDLSQNVSFAGYPDIGFATKNQVAGRDGMGVQAGMDYAINKDVQIGASVSSDAFRKGYDSVSGNLYATWHF